MNGLIISSMKDYLTGSFALDLRVGGGTTGDIEGLYIYFVHVEIHFV